MKTINLSNSTISAETPDPRDEMYPASDTFKRGWLVNSDGIHFYSQFPDGKTRTHTKIGILDLMAMVERHEPNFKIPVESNPKPAINNTV